MIHNFAGLPSLCSHVLSIYLYIYISIFLSAYLSRSCRFEEGEEECHNKTTASISTGTKCRNIF